MSPEHKQDVREAAVTTALMLAAALAGYQWEFIDWWWGIPLLIALVGLAIIAATIRHLIKAADNASFETYPREY